MKSFMHFASAIVSSNFNETFHPTEFTECSMALTNALFESWILQLMAQISNTELSSFKGVLTTTRNTGK